MNKITINKQQMDLLMQAVREMYLSLESSGKTGTDEHRSLRYLEDTLGSMSGEKFHVEAQVHK
ncbi:MAG: hypothetical protein ACOYL3_14960 [Desulfuromonadaceae bacterium]